MSIPLSIAFACALCDEHPLFEGKQSFGQHVQEKHPDALTDTGIIDVTVSLIASKDYSDRYENTFQGKLPDGRVLFECRRSEEREPGDPMRLP